VTTPVRFAVQRSDRTRWKTVLVEATEAGAIAVFHDMVRVNRRGYFRVVRLSPRGEDPNSAEFDWRLLMLYDPKKATVLDANGNDIGAVPAAPSGSRGSGTAALRAAGAATKSPPRTGERVRAPLQLYLSTIVIGTVIAAGLYLAFGRQYLLSMVTEFTR